MTSVFAESKLYFDELFQGLWCDAPIHFGGEEFDSKDLDKWINIFYKPTYGDHVDLCSTTMNYGVLYIACWGSNDLEAMALSDSIIAFINTNIDKTLYRVRRFEVPDHGYNETNYAYVLVSFDIEVLAR